MLKSWVEKIKKHKYKILATVSFVAAGYFFYCSLTDDKSIKMSTFLEALHSHQIDEIVLKGQVIYFRSETSDWYYTILGSYPISELFKEIKSIPSLTYSSEKSDDIMRSILEIVIAASTFAGSYLIFKGNNIIGQTDHSRKTNTTQIESFKNFYGGEEIKQILKEVVDYAVHADKYEKNGLRMRRGILFHGPPGTGKTMLARIFANEAGLPFLTASASEFQEIFVGVGPKRIRDIFKTAKSIKEGCVIFIDEIDAIGSRNEIFQSKENRATINQLLTEMDGFTQNSKVFIIAATNNIKLIDQALLRPGRFDIKVYIPPPSLEDREGILKVLLDSKKIPSNLTDEDFLFIAKETEGWCGAHLENLLNETGYAAMRENSEKIELSGIRKTLKIIKENDSHSI